MRPFLIGSVALAGLVVACNSTQRIDLCRRGDRVDLASFDLTALDAAGSVLDQWSVPADRSSSADDSLPTGTRRVRADGIDGASVPVAFGEAEIADLDAVCVCVSTLAQHEVACRNVVCHVSNDRCVFTDESGAAIGSTSVTFGENATDDIRGVTVDTYLSAETARQTHNFGSDTVVHIGSDPTAPRVGLWQFDLRAIPSTAQVVSATLAVTTLDNATDAPLQLFAVLEEWDAGSGRDTVGCSSWTCRSPGPPQKAWATPGAGPPTSSSATPLVSIFPSLTTTRYEATSEPLRALVQQWVSSPGDNHGLTARIASTSNASLALGSAEGADGTRPELRVELSIPTDPR